MERNNQVKDLYVNEGLISLNRHSLTCILIPIINLIRSGDRHSCIKGIPISTKRCLLGEQRPRIGRKWCSDRNTNNAIWTMQYRPKGLVIHKATKSKNGWTWMKPNQHKYTKIVLFNWNSCTLFTTPDDFVGCDTKYKTIANEIIDNTRLLTSLSKAHGPTTG